MLTITLHAGAGDCWVGAAREDIDTGSNNIYVGKGGMDPQETRRAWLPFAGGTIPAGSTISLATLKLTANGGGAGANAIRIGCEAADNPADPTTAVNLRARTLSTATTTASLSTWVIGDQYSYNITTAVAEIVARPGFAYGDTIAVMIDDNGSSTDGWRDIASYENSTYAEAELEIQFIEAGSVLRAPGFIGM